jgi:hypothetical protein
MFDGDIQFVPLLEQKSWSIPLNSIFIPSTSGGPGTTLTPSQNETSAEIDSGSTITTGPESLVDAFYAAVDGAVRGETIDAAWQGYWLVPCATTVNVKFVFGNVTVTLAAATLHESETASVTSPTTGQLLCLGTLKGDGGQTSSPAWIFGDSLLKSVRTT